MIVRAQQKSIRLTAKKLRLIANLVRGKDLATINTLLVGLNKTGAREVNETIRQAVANAVNVHAQAEADLKLKTIMINEGQTLKRFRAGPRGRAKPYVKRTSHIFVELEAITPVAPVAAPIEPAKEEQQVVEAAPAKKVVKKTTKAKAAPAKKVAKTTAKETA